MISFFQQKKDKKILNKFNNYFNKDNWVNGNIIIKLEKKIKKFLKTKHNVITCNSGSDALLISLLLNKNKKKDVYLTSPISYIASASIPRFLNLELIYIDVKKDNYLMCLDKLENFLENCPNRIKKRINGIINVELFGHTCDLDRLKKISKKYKLSLIGDCAQSFGSKYNNKSTINYYDYAATSFYPTKILSCYGDGGAIFFKDNYKKVLRLKNNGHDLKNKSNCYQIGINSRLDSIQALVLNDEINKLKNKIVLKNKIFNFYKKFINQNSYLQLVKNFNKKIQSNNYIFAILIKKNRIKLMKHMRKNGIDCKIFYKKLLPNNNVLKPIFKTDLKNSIKCSKELLCIPSNERLKEKQIKKIVKTINNLNF
tara:strand:- start:1495 stop:2604 length:1110 start_codon:yes stop_codon:yes gene_type:complete